MRREAATLSCVSESINMLKNGSVMATIIQDASVVETMNQESPEYQRKVAEAVANRIGLELLALASATIPPLASPDSGLDGSKSALE
jgi:hypothetical protein